MKITEIDAFQVAWAANDTPAQRSAFVILRTDDGLTGIGEASPMQGGAASLGMHQRQSGSHAAWQGSLGPRRTARSGNAYAD